MAVSGTVSTTVFNTNRVVDTAFRRCRLPAQAITSEMQQYARDALYLWLSQLANSRPPSWCIERLVLPMYAGQPTVTLPIGTVDVLNLNYRVLQALEPVAVTTASSYTADFTDESPVVSVGVKWLATSPALTFSVSDDNIAWTVVGTQAAGTLAGEWSWTDISQVNAYRYFRVVAATPISYSDLILGNMPQEIPMGLLNRDSFTAQSNKTMQSRPVTYWYQRDRVNPILNLWPAPNPAAEGHQLIVWRHRHIMDVGTLQQEIEVPQRWMEALIAGLADRLAQETPAVDAALMPLLAQRSAIALQDAWTGDGDGSPTYYQPKISAYTA